MTNPADKYFASVENEVSGRDATTGCPLFTPRIVKNAFTEGVQYGLITASRLAREEFPELSLASTAQDIDLVLQSALEKLKGLKVRQAVRRLLQTFKHGHLGLLQDESKHWNTVFRVMKDVDPTWILYPDEAADVVAKILAESNSTALRRYHFKSSVIVCAITDRTWHRFRWGIENTLRYRLFLKGASDNMPIVWNNCREPGVWRVTVYGTRRTRGKPVNAGAWELSSRTVNYTYHQQEGGPS